MRWTWQSIAPAVRILPLPAMTSVPGPMTRSGWTPSMVSGLPALPSATIRPSRMPTSALTTPQWSRTTAPVITSVGGALGAGGAAPGPSTRGSPCRRRRPPRRRPGRARRRGPRSTSMSRSVSASRIRSPVVGPYSCGVALAATAAPSRPALRSRRAGPGTTPGAGQRHQVDRRAAMPGLEADGGAGGDVQPVPARGRPVELQRRRWPRRSGSASRPAPAGRRC